METDYETLSRLGSGSEGPVFLCKQKVSFVCLNDILLVNWETCGDQKDYSGK